MRALLVLLSAVFMLSGCSKEVKPVSTTTTLEPLEIREMVKVDLLLSESDLGKYMDAEEGFWKEARKAGLIKLFNKILNRNISLVPLAGTTGIDGGYGFYSQTGVLDAQQDQETGDFAQSFVLSATFNNDLSVGGQIVSLEEGTYVAGSDQIAYAMLYQAVPQTLPAYVAIVEPIAEVGSNFYRLIGMAEVIQVTRTIFAMPKDQGGATGAMCSLEIVVSDREVEVGDRIFLMNLDVTALASDAIVTEDGEPEIVQVLPPHRDTVQEPKEKK
jgi:hypothetical protein